MPNRQTGLFRTLPVSDSETRYMWSYINLPIICKWMGDSEYLLVYMGSLLARPLNPPVFNDM